MKKVLYNENKVQKYHLLTHLQVSTTIKVSSLDPFISLYNDNIHEHGCYSHTPLQKHISLLLCIFTLFFVLPPK